MADIKLNFSSQWPSIQVVKVVTEVQMAGDPASHPYIRKIKHGLEFPPLAIGLLANQSTTSYGTPLQGMDVDSTYVYVSSEPTSDRYPTSVVVYNIDISRNFDYSEYTSEVGDVLEDKTVGSLDLRKFLLHSRAVSPMLLSVKTKTYTTSDLSFNYTHPLNYPIFNFGYVRWSYDGGANAIPVGTWVNAPLASQAFPWLNTNGFTSSLGSTTTSGQLVADIGSIITLRNPAIITSNSVSASL